MKNFSGAFLWLTASEIIFNVAAYVVHASVGRILGPADYGRYGLVVTLTTMIIVLIGNGVPTAMAKYISEHLGKNPEKIYAIRHQAAKIQILLILLVTVLFFFLSPAIAWMLGDPSLTPLFQISTLVIPAFAAASFYHHYFTGLHLFKLQSIVKIARSFARVGFIVLAAYYLKLEGAVGGYIMAPLLTFGVALLIDIFYVQRKLGIGLKKESAFTFPARTVIAYAWPITLFLVFYEFILTIDLYLVKAILGDDHATGLYNAAITVGRIPYYLFSALAMILLPSISKTTAEADHKTTQEIMTISLRMLSILLLPMVALLCASAPELLHLLYGNGYADASASLRIFTIGVGFLTVFYILAFALNGAGLVHIPMKLSVVGLVLSLPLNLVLIPSFGIAGAAFATTIASFGIMIGVIFSARKYFTLRIRNRDIFLPFLFSLGIGAIAYGIGPTSLWFIFFDMALFGAYIAILSRLRVITSQDTKPFRKIFGRKEQ